MRSNWFHMTDSFCHSYLNSNVISKEALSKPLHLKWLTVTLSHYPAFLLYNNPHNIKYSCVCLLSIYNKLWTLQGQECWTCCLLFIFHTWHIVGAQLIILSKWMNGSKCQTTAKFHLVFSAVKKTKIFRSIQKLRRRSTYEYFFGTWKQTNK